MRRAIILLLLLAVAPCFRAEAEPSLRLRTESSAEGSVRPGEPFVAVATIIDYEAQMLQSEFAAARSLLAHLPEMKRLGEITHEELERQTLELEAVAAPPGIVIGSEATPWYSQLRWQVRNGDTWTELSWSRSLLSVPPPPATGTVGGTGVLAAGYGFDPAATAGIPPARYTIRAGLPASVLMDGSSQEMIWSDEIEILFSGSASRSVGGSMQVERSYEEGRYLALYMLLRGEPARALEIAKGLQARRPGDINLHEIIGDAYAALGQLEPATEAYQRAIDIYNARQPQPYGLPDILIEKANRTAWTILQRHTIEDEGR